MLISSPNDGTPVAMVDAATAESLDAAVSSARAAFDGRSSRTAGERARIMHLAASSIRQDCENLAKLISIEMGKPIQQARSEAKNCADLIDFFAEEGLRIVGEVPKLDLKNELPLVVKEPVGVVGAITPFNYPIALLIWKLGPALICGCTLVAKPDEHAPSAAVRVAELFKEAGLPSGVFEVVMGGSDVGEQLVAHAGIEKIAFTGGVESGRAVAATAARAGKRVTLELGGQCPAIITADADLATAVPPLVKHTFNNSGQYCYRINRIYVDQAVHAEFVDAFVEATRKLHVLPSTDESADIGPLCHEGILSRSLSHIEDAQKRGGRVVFGGERLTDGHYQNGYFLMPTVIDGCSQEMLLMREETFGPVVGISATGSIRESVQLANDTIFGLAAYVFSKDSGLGLQIARRLRAGSVWVNGVKQAYPQLPFGGYKASGSGREKSHFGMDEYLELKSIYLALPEL